MPNHADKFLTPLALDQVIMVCREAIASVNWRVLEQGTNRLKCKEVAIQSTSFTWPAEVEIILFPHPKGTVIAMNGTIFGWGPIQASHLKGQMGNLKNRIEIGLSKLFEDQKQQAASTPISQSSSLITELERLANLHAKGMLTDDEFQSAKKKLLNV